MTTPHSIPLRPRWHAWVANGFSFLVGFGLFAWLLTRFGGIAEVLASGVVATAVTALLWWLTWQFLGSISTRLPGTPIASVPDFRKRVAGPAPALTSPGSAYGMVYRDAVARLEADTHGQVLLVTAPSPGQGATTTALNLAIAASRAGRRVLLVDGDVNGEGLSRYAGLGDSPGLTDLAAGNADLRACARLWHISPRNRLPVIPSGSTNGATPDLRTMTLADALDRITERADLVLVDAPPVLWSSTTEDLAAHADGTVLVVGNRTRAAAVAEAHAKMEAMGAPVVGHVVNRSSRRAGGGGRVGNLLLRFLSVFALLLLTYGLWAGYQLYDSWRNLETVPFDPVAARDQLAAQATVTGGEEIEPEIEASLAPAVPISGDPFEAYLVIGSDAREEIGGARADAIVLMLIPRDGSEPAIVSLPRDLYITNPCNAERAQRINANLNGCGAVSGPNVMALAVEDFTGIAVDHAILFDFEGFADVIDEVGGYEICVDHRTRDIPSELDIPAGCTIADGETTLAWVRSRSTQQLVDGTWKSVSGVNDLTRNQRQQEVILDMFSRIGQFGTLNELTGVVAQLSHAFTLDDNISLADAANLAWDLRGIDPATIKRLTIPVEGYVTSAGAQVLLPTVAFETILTEAYPDLATAS